MSKPQLTKPPYIFQCKGCNSELFHCVRENRRYFGQKTRYDFKTRKYRYYTVITLVCANCGLTSRDFDIAEEELKGMTK